MQNAYLISSKGGNSIHKRVLRIVSIGLLLSIFCLFLVTRVHAANSSIDSIVGFLNSIENVQYSADQNNSTYAKMGTINTGEFIAYLLANPIPSGTNIEVDLDIESLVSTKSITVTLQNKNNQVLGSKQETIVGRNTSKKITFSSSSYSQNVTRIEVRLNNSFSDLTGLLLYEVNVPAAASVETTPPTMPIGLAAIAGNNKVDLSWNSVSSATSYNVKRSTTPGGPYTIIASAVDSPFYTDYTVSSGTTYYYIVTAINTIGESSSSNEVSAAPVGSGTGSNPSTPAVLTIHFVSGLSKLYNLTMTEVNNFISWYNGRTEGTGSEYYTFTKTATSTLTHKEYAVYSKIEEFEVIEDTSSTSVQVTAPTNLAAVGAVSKIQLNWNAVSGITSYNVKRAVTAEGPFTTTAANIDRTNYEDTTVNNGTTYYYVVTAVQNGTESGNSSVVSAVSLAPLVLPGTILNLTASTPSTSPITLSWTAPVTGNVAGTSNYDIRYSTTPITESNWSSATQLLGEPVRESAGTSQTVVVDGLTANTLYYFAIKTIDAAGNASELSNIASSSYFYSEELVFDGVDDLITIGDIGARPEKGTIEFWMNSSAVESYRNPFGTNISNVGIRFEMASNYNTWHDALYVVMGDNDNNFSVFPYTTASNPLSENVWYHVAIVWDSSQNKAWGYLNGELVFDETQTFWNSDFSYVKLGNGVSTTTPSDRWFEGKLRDIRIWNVARSEEQIQGSMNGVNSNETGLIVRR
jgi:fibronectin type 3 domain-containing protein